MLFVLPHPTPASTGQKTRLPTNGFSLIEVIVGLGIFTMMMIGILHLTFQVRASAEEAVYNNTALTLAQAYLEQMRSIDFATLQAAAEDESRTVDLNLISSAGTLLTDRNGGVFSNKDWANETIMLDEDEEGNPRQPLKFELRPVLTDLSSVTGGIADGVEIVLWYRSRYNFGMERTQIGTLRTVRSNVSTF